MLIQQVLINQLMKYLVMSKVHNIDTYKPTSTDVFFFDNNVWMFLFCPIGNYKKDKQSKYSTFFSAICTAKACIWINSLVLSEFCNSWLRLEFYNWRNKSANAGKNDYKSDFVGTQEYKDTIQDIKKTLPQLLKKSERNSDNFNAINLDSIYSELENCDFNDSYYLELSRMNKWKIVTDDADFFKKNKLNVEIITANIK